MATKFCIMIKRVDNEDLGARLGALSAYQVDGVLMNCTKMDGKGTE
jgi:hypothetical protein